MRAGNGVKDEGERQNVQMAEMVAVWQLLFEASHCSESP